MIFQFTTKQLERYAKKAEKDQKKEEAKVKKVEWNTCIAHKLTIVYTNYSVFSCQPQKVSLIRFSFCTCSGNVLFFNKNQDTWWIAFCQKILRYIQRITMNECSEVSYQIKDFTQISM